MAVTTDFIISSNINGCNSAWLIPRKICHIWSHASFRMCHLKNFWNHPFTVVHNFLWQADLSSATILSNKKGLTLGKVAHDVAQVIPIHLFVFCLFRFYCAGDTNPKPTGPCSPGHFCTGGASTPTQNVTPKGHFSSVAASSPVKCPVGTYQEVHTFCWYQCKRLG